MILEIHIQGPFGGSLVFSGDPNPPPEDTGGRRSRGPSPARSPLSRTAPGRLEQLDQDDEEDTTHLKKVHLVCRLLFLQIRLCCPFCMVLLLILSNSLNVQNGFASLDAVLKSFPKDLVFLLQPIYAWLPAGQNGAVVRAVSGRPPPYQAKQAEQEQLFVLTQVLVSTALCTQAIMHDNL